MARNLLRNKMEKKFYKVSQLQWKGGLSDNNHWVTIGSVYASSPEEAKKKAVENLTLTAEPERE